LIVLDTSFLLALLDEDDAGHQAAGSWYSRENSPFATTPLVLAELDYLLHARAMPAVVAAFYGEVRRGSLGVEWWPGLDGQAADVADR
jgi:predicted nucleic acid-binding protein